MSFLRRSAARLILLQPSRQLLTVRPTSTRIPVLSSSKPSTYRSFHQSRIWRAVEDEQKPVDAETGAESEAVVEETIEQADAAASASEAAELAEETSANADSADAAADGAEIAEEAAEAALGAAEGAEASAEAATEAEGGEVAAAAAQSAATSAGVAAAAAVSAQSPPASRQAEQIPRFPPNDAPVGSDFRDVQPSRILYIGNLFFEVTADQLAAEFSKYGQVTNSRLVTDARGLSRGFGYVEMDTQENAERAIREADQSTFEGRRMAVQFHVRRDRNNRSNNVGRGGRTREPNPPAKTLFIGNMSYQMSDKDLNDLFREIRDVLDVRVAIDRRTGQPRGFAHADFIDIAAAERAKKVLEQKVVYGRPLKIDFGLNSAATRSPT